MSDISTAMFIATIVSILGIIATKIFAKSDKEMTSNTYICLKQCFYFFIVAGIIALLLLASSNQIPTMWRAIEIDVATAAIASMVLTRIEASSINAKANKGMMMFQEIEEVRLFSRVNIVGFILAIIAALSITAISFSLAENIMAVIAILAIALIVMFLILADTAHQLNRAALINYGYMEALYEYVEDDSKPRVDLTVESDDEE